MQRYLVPSKPPVYTSTPTPIEHNSKRIYATLDSAFAGMGLLLTFWFVVLLLMSGLSFSWHSILSLIAFWLVLTYLALPRMHQIFTTLYLPDYFMARTKTGDGVLGDPVNLAILGSEEDIHAAMRRAGWVQADKITLRSSLGIIRSTLTRTPYPAAPVSDLFLFDHRHDFAYQQDVDGNAAQRHHVRFWRVPDGWRLPGGERADWLAAGTYDKSVGLSTLTLQVTHKIDANVDAERDYIINTVRFQDPECTVRVIERFSTSFHDRNGGGDAIHTDGDMPVLDVTGADDRADAAGLGRAESSAKALDEKDILNTEPPPKQFTYVGIFLILQTAALMISMADLLLSGPDGRNHEKYTLAVGSTILTLAMIVVVWALFILAVNRYRWGRLGFLILATIAAVVRLLLWSTGEFTSLPDIIGTGVSVLLVLAFSAPSVRDWVFTVRRRGGNAPIGL